MTTKPRLFLDRYLLLGIALSLGTRVLAAAYLGNDVEALPGIADQVSYHNLALRVLGGHGFSFGQTWWPVTQAGAPTAHWSFLYTYFLTAVYAVFGPHPLAARLIQVLITGVLQPWLAFLIGRRLFNRNTGLAAAGITAMYAYFIYYAGALMTESFFITAVLASLYLAINWDPQKPFPAGRGAALGAVIGAAVLLRQLYLLFVPFLLGWLIWVQWHRTRKIRWGSIALCALIPALMILPFTIYNTLRFDRFVLLNTNAGYAFFWANHPIYGTKFIEILPPEMGDYVSLIPQELWKMDEASLEREMMKRGLDFVVQDPGRYILLSLSRIPAYFKFWPSAQSGMLSNISRVASFGIAWPFMLAGIVLAIIRRARPIKAWLASVHFLLILFMAVYTGIHLLSWALIRYRLPVDAVLIVFAGLTVTEIIIFFQKRGARAESVEKTEEITVGAAR